MEAAPATALAAEAAARTAVNTFGKSPSGRGAVEAVLPARLRTAAMAPDAVPLLSSPWPCAKVIVVAKVGIFKTNCRGDGVFGGNIQVSRPVLWCLGSRLKDQN